MTQKQLSGSELSAPKLLACLPASALACLRCAAALRLRTTSTMKAWSAAMSSPSSSSSLRGVRTCMYTGVSVSVEGASVRAAHVRQRCRCERVQSGLEGPVDLPG
jgi:hypothetical protein